MGPYWQLPVFAVSLLLLGIGWYVALPERHEYSISDHLGRAQEFMAAGRFDEVTRQLDAVERRLDEAKPDQGRQYHFLRGDVAWSTSLNKAAGQRVRHAAVVVDAYEQAGGVRSAERQERYVACLIDLGRLDAALKELEAAGAQRGVSSQRLMRQVIERLLADSSRAGQAQQLLQQFINDPALERDSQVWAVEQIAGRMLASGKSQSALAFLLRWYGRLQLDGRQGLGSLMVMLGQAYASLGDMVPAEQWYLRVRDHVDAADPLNGAALVGLGQVRLAENNVVDALEHFDHAATRFPGTRWQTRALVGKAECEARMGGLSDALRDYKAAVEVVRSAVGVRGAEDLRRLSESLAGQREWRYAQGEYEFALKLLELEQGLHGDQPPADLLLRLATTHEQIARQALGLASDQPITTAIWRSLDPMQRGKISTHFERAADYFLAHASAVAVTDNDAYGEALWRAGAAYDESGMHDKAIEVFVQFLDERADDDPHRLQVVYRLGRAYQADGNYDKAIGQLETLVTDHPKSPEAYDSLVPLAQCYLAKGSAYWSKAEHLLTTVVSDHAALRPASTEYRDALIELGRMYYRRGEPGDYDQAIARLDEAAKRYGDQPELPALMFQLGDAYRKSIGEIEAELAKAPPPSRKVELQAERARRLGEARKCFDDVVAKLDAPEAGELTDLQKLYLRNAYFYRADCSYDLRQFEGPTGAIALYQKAVQRYEKEPAVLVAWIQIVNCYCELGKFNEARSANNQAKWYLKRIPDQAFADPNLPMSREHWQRWLDWTSQLELRDSTAAAQP